MTYDDDHPYLGPLSHQSLAEVLEAVEMASTQTLSSPVQRMVITSNASPDAPSFVERHFNRYPARQTVDLPRWPD